MTDQSDILGTEATNAPATAPVEATAPTVATPAEPTYMEQLRSIKNEQGLQKYATVEDAIASTVFAQDHIQKLEAELSAERAEKQAALAAQEAAAQAQFASTQEPQPQAPGLGREDVYSAMEEYELRKSRQSNRKSVVDTLVQYCNGDEVKANEMVSAKLKELNMSRTQLATLSETTPTAVYSLLGVDGKGTNTGSITSATINTDAVETQNGDREIPRAASPKVGASTQTLVNEWKASQQEANKRLGLS